MLDQLLSLLGGSLFIPLAVAYVLALLTGIVLMLRSSVGGSSPTS